MRKRYWGVAKSARHMALTHAFAGSSPATPAKRFMVIARNIGEGL